MKRVVVTGIGAVCPIGNSLKEAWAAAKAGISGIAPVTRFDVSGVRWTVAGELKEFVAVRLSPKEIGRLDPFVHYAVAAAGEAAEDAGLIGQDVIESAGVVIGSSRGGICTLEKEFLKRHPLFLPHRTSRVSAYLMPATTISMASSYVALKLGIRGSCFGISNACASGASAIGESYRLIKSGYESIVLCGGTEAPICRVSVEGYGASGALSRGTDSSASRPFDMTRDGFVLSEGACILVLEDYESALRRGVRIYGEIVGYGSTADAYHQTRPYPEGEARAIKRALDSAEIYQSHQCSRYVHASRRQGRDACDKIGLRQERVSCPGDGTEIFDGAYACRIRVSRSGLYVVRHGRRDYPAYDKSQRERSRM
jgi:3-oxoacyl-[acyl-carrier-protein] synthase II